MDPNYNKPNSSHPFNSFSFMDKSEDQPYHVHDVSFSLSSRTIIPNTDQDHTPWYYREHLQLQNQVKDCQSTYSSMEKAGDSARKSSSIWEKEDGAESQTEHGSSDKWMSSKMRMMRKMMSSDQQQKTPSKSMQQKFQDHKQLSSSLETDNSSNSNNSPYRNSNSNNNNIIRICSDCNTTKTPLWRSGPKGPKSLCNACGIRQRKARRAMAAAAAAAEAEAKGAAMKNNNNVQHKEKGGSNAESFLKPFKKRFKVKTTTPPSAATEENNKTGLEELTMSLSKQYSAFQQVFPQDEREGAILLMALSHGLVHS